MALSSALVRRHISDWSTRLRAYPRCAGWPHHLYHAAHVVTAAKILLAGRLVCRRNLGEIDHDVANQGALHNNPFAHEYVRLYFRPRTAFHLRTEGIKPRKDPYRQKYQMSIPILLAFDAESVLSDPRASFSMGMLSKERDLCDGDEAFESLDFASVFHDGPAEDPKEHRRVQDAQMAEVVLPRALRLDPYLRSVICRNPMERRCLLHLLGAGADAWRSRVTTEQVFCSSFFHKYLYLSWATFRDSTLSLKLHMPYPRPATGTYRVRVEQSLGGEIFADWSGEVGVEAGVLNVSGFSQDQGCIWRVLIEDDLAYEGPVSGETSVVR